MNSDLCKTDIDGSALGWVEMSGSRDSALVIYYNAKAVPLQAWTGPEGYGRLRFVDFKTICTWRL